MSTYKKHDGYYNERTTCRRYNNGEEPRDDGKRLSTAIERKSSVESDRVGKRRDGVRTKYCDVDIEF